MDADFYKRMAEAVESATPVYLATVVLAEGSTPNKVGAKMLVYPDGRILGTIGGGDIERRVIEIVMTQPPREITRLAYDLADGLHIGQPTASVCGGHIEVLVEPLGQADRLVIFGGGHCGIELSHLARRVGFRVTVYDPRSEWACAERHPDAAEFIVVQYTEAGTRIQPDERTYLVIMTHGHAHDEELLRLLLPTTRKYLGMIGSRNKVRLFFERLLAEGVPQAELDRVCSPIGLDIHSHSPAEIAVSIVAQLIAVRNG